jgi:hypothetical protein
LVTKPATSPGRLHTRGKHRKQPLHRKEPAGQGVSAARSVLVGALAAVLLAVLGFAGLIAKRATDDSVPIAGGAWRPSPPLSSAPITQPPRKTRGASTLTVPPKPFPSDDSGFIDSSARCDGTQPAFAISRTQSSLVVICGERTGQYEYLGVRLSDAAMVRTAASTDSPHGFLAQKAGVLYAVSPSELKVTAGSTVIKQEPMIEYRAVAR